MLCFQKICNFCVCKIFFSYDFKFFDGTIGCATKFHANEMYIFCLSIFVRSKVKAFFCEKFSKVEHTICDCN